MPDYTITTTETNTLIAVTEEVVNITVSSDPTVSVVTIGTQGPPGLAAERLKTALAVGTKNGVNRQFTLGEEFEDILDVQLNGLGGEAFTVISTTVFELAEAPEATDTIKVFYY